MAAAKHAERCLPLVIANEHGWEILAPEGFEVTWNGGLLPNDVKVTPDKKHHLCPVGIFGHGIMTLHIGCVARTEPGINLLIGGPMNDPKDGIGPLTGIVECDWLPFTATMNWKLTRPHNTVRFEKDEPICHIYPLPRYGVDRTEAEIRDMTIIERTLYKEWSDSRRDFIRDKRIGANDVKPQDWQKTYFQGKDRPGPKGRRVVDHQTKVRARSFERT